MKRTPIHDVDRISCELIARYRAGDQSAFNELVELHTPLITKLVRSSVGNLTPSNAHWRQDLKQEGLLALAIAVRPGNYDPDRVSFGTYLYISVSNRIARYTVQYEGLITTPPNYTSPDLEFCVSHGKKKRIDQIFTLHC